MLKFELENLDGLDDSLKNFYTEHDGKYRLKVDGLDAADELKNALKKERESNKEAKTKLAELEKLRDEAEKKAMEEQGKYKELSEKERQEKLEAQKRFDELQTKIAKSRRDLMVRDLASSMTNDPVEIEAITRFAVDYVDIEGEEVKFNKDENSIKEELSRFVRSKASGTNDGGNNGKGGKTTPQTFKEKQKALFNKK